MLKNLKETFVFGASSAGIGNSYGNVGCRLSSAYLESGNGFSGLFSSN